MVPTGVPTVPTRTVWKPVSLRNDYQFHWLFMFHTFSILRLYYLIPILFPLSLAIWTTKACIEPIKKKAGLCCLDGRLHSWDFWCYFLSLPKRLLVPEQITVFFTSPVPYQHTSIFLFQFWITRVKMAITLDFVKGPPLYLSPYDTTLHW